ncbi:MAG: DUF1523 family protein [bacterium]
MKRFNLFSLVIIILLGFFIGYPILYLSSQDTIEITVYDKERIVTKTTDNIKTMYLVYCEDEVFKNTDNWFFFKFNSSDIQNKLKVNQTYVVKVVGWRIPFFSSYRNIVKIYDTNE